MLVNKDSMVIMKKNFILSLFICFIALIGISYKSFAFDTPQPIELARQITMDDILDIQRAACFFASGEGGSLRMSTELLDEIKVSRTDWKKVKLISRAALSSNDFVFGTAVIGAPEPPGYFKTHSPVSLVEAGVEASSKYIAKKQSAKNATGNIVISPIENGALNLAYPLLVGMANGFMVYDGDMSGGRSIPQIINSSLANIDVNGVVVGIKSNQYQKITYFPVHKASVLQDILANLWAKNKQNKQFLAFATSYMSGKQFINNSIFDHSISYDLAIGRAMNVGTIENSYQLVLQRLSQIYGKNQVFRLFEGRLGDIKFYPGFNTKGYILLLDIHNQNIAMKIYFSNENVMATTGDIKDGKYIEKRIVAMAPDSINYLLPHGIKNKRYCGALTLANSDIFAEGLKKLKGVEITVIGLPNYSLRTPKVIKSFKKYIDDLAPNINKSYLPLEKINSPNM